MKKDFVSEFEARAKALCEAHEAARKASKEVLSLQIQLADLDGCKTAAVKAGQFGEFARLLDEITATQKQLISAEASATDAKAKDTLTPELVAEMHAAFTEQLDAADRADVEQMLPHVKALREIAKRKEERNTHANEIRRSLDLCIGYCYTQLREDDAAYAVKKLLTSRSIREALGEAPNMINPAFVEL